MSLGTINKEKDGRADDHFQENILTKEILFCSTSEILLYMQIIVGLIPSHSWLFLKAHP